VAEPEPEQEAQAAASIVEQGRRIVVIDNVGYDPEILGAEQYMDWQLQAIFLRCAEIAKGEE
jgi:hypothetical protein